MKIKFFKKKVTRAKLLKELNPYNGYSILRSSTHLNEKNEFLLQVSKNYDEYGYISEELGEELDKLFDDEEYVIGIHRTGYNYMSPEMINEILNKGLINNGHMMQGGFENGLDIDRTVTLFNHPDEFPIFMGQLKAAHGYKDSQGIIVVKIPKSYLGQKEGEIRPIYYKHDGSNKLLPEFIYGYIPTDQNGVLGDIVRNPNYKDKHDLISENLLYESSAEIKLKKQGIDINKTKTDSNTKYQIIEKAYKDTLLKYGKEQAVEALLRLINDNDVMYFTGEENKALLSKYVIYSEIMPILMLASPDLRVYDENTIMQNFINSCNSVLEQNKKIV